MSVSQRTRIVGLSCLVVTAVGWGLNWPIIKIVLRDWPPLFARSSAGLVAATGLAIMAVLAGQRLTFPLRLLPRLLLAAAFNVLAWMGLGTMAMVWLSVAEGTLLTYTMPIWATLLAWPLRGTRPRGIDLLALGLAAAGVLVLFAGAGVSVGTAKVPGVLLALAAAMLFALGTVIGSSALPLAPVALTAWQVGLGCLPMFLAGVLFERPDVTSLAPAGWAGMAYMTVIPMGVCYLTWFAASRRLPPQTAATGMLLVPIVGVCAAAPIAAEPLGIRQALAMVLTLGGVLLAVRNPPPPPGGTGGGP